MWIKQPSSGNDVTGTMVMMAEPSSPSGLKQTKGGIVLDPQPQDDPNDPLNWPLVHRDIALITVSMFALLCGGQTPILAPVMNVLSTEFGESLHRMTYLVGVFMAAMGVGSAIFAPIAVKYGKRLVYLFSLLIFFAGLVWGANATSYSSLMGARVLCGIGCSPAESLPSTTIAEIYFAHERAYRIGIYTLLLLGGKNLSPLASGFTANRLGWHWIFWVCAIICGAAFAATFLFVHETWWQRVPIPDKRSLEETEAVRRAKALSHPEELFRSEQPIFRAETVASDNMEKPNKGSESKLDNDAARDNDAAEDADAAKHADTAKHADNVTADNDANDTVAKTADDMIDNRCKTDGAQNGAESNATDEKTKVPFFRNLRIYSGQYSEAKYWVVFLRPMMLYAYLPVLFSTLVYGSSVVWLSVLAETITTIFSKEPYNFKTTSIGLLYIATFVGSILGSLVSGKVSDILVRYMCRRNGGVYEPEFRLVMILPVMIAITIGLMAFGWSTAESDAWIVPAVFMGFLGFGTSLGSTVSITYIVDCYRKYALETLVSLNFAKNILGLAFSIFVPYFLEGSGSKTSFIVYGCVEIGICLLAIPLYHYGKVIRSFYDKKAWIEVLYR